MNNAVKKINKNSQQKIRNILKKEGKVSISDFVTKNTKNTLVSIKQDLGYKRLGDSIDFLAEFYKCSSK